MMGTSAGMTTFDLFEMLAVLDVDEDYPIGAVRELTPRELTAFDLVFVRLN